MRLATVVLLILGASGSGCVTGTAFQRAVALQQGRSSSDDINQALHSQNWKLRCLAARACGRSGDGHCLTRLAALAATDTDENVQSCAFEGIAFSCDHGGRQALADIATSAPLHEQAGRAFLDAVASCPSADAMLAVAKRDDETSRDALSHVDPGVDLPEAVLERERYLARLGSLPSPKAKVEAALADAREEAHRRAGENTARVAREQQESVERRRSAESARAAAGRLLAEGDLDAAQANIERAERLGAEVSDLEESLAAARLAKGKSHLSRAWALVRRDKPDEALAEADAARALGVEDERLAEAVEATATVRKRRAAEHREQRAEEKRQENAARQNAVGLARERCPEIYRDFAEYGGIVGAVNYAFRSSGAQLSAFQARAVVEAMGSRAGFIRWCVASVTNAVGSCNKKGELPSGWSKSECFVRRSASALTAAPYAACRNNATERDIVDVCLVTELDARRSVKDEMDARMGHP